MERLKRDVDFNEFLKVLTRKGNPRYLPFYEHIASPGFIARRTETPFDTMSFSDPGFWEIYTDFWLGMGFDCVPMEIPLNCPLPEGHGGISETSEAHVVIRNRRDFEQYPWPDPSAPIDFSHFETVAKLLPDNVKIVGGVMAGPYEWGSQMMGTVGMSYLLADDPELVAMVFEKIGSLHHSAVRQLATFDAIGALRQGDDLGFKTSTFLPPDLIRKLILPTYKNMAEEAHRNGKPFILHSCGQLGAIYEDLIEFCKIDAKHSFEDVILPVGEFKRRYGTRITPLGGLDVDVICRAPEPELRAYARRHIEECFYDGHWALGTGNSLTNYMPVANYIAVLEEGMKVTS